MVNCVRGFWEIFPGDFRSAERTQKKHKACCKKYKAHILK